AERERKVAELATQKQPQDREAVIEVSRAHVRIGRAKGSDGSSASTRELPEAIAHDREAVIALTNLAENHDATSERSIFQATLALAYHLRKNREFDESLKVYDKLLSMSNTMQSLPAVSRENLRSHRALVFDHIGEYQRAYEDNR